MQSTARRKAAWKKAALAVGLAAMLAVSACSSNNNGGGNTGGGNENGSATTGSASASPDQDARDGGNGTAGNAKDPFGKYDPPIEISTVKSLDDGSMRFVNGETIENNVWTQGMKEELGIILKVDWLVPDNQYGEKVNVTIASNDLPDIMQVGAIQLNQLVENGMIEDLTQLMGDYQSDLTKEYMSLDGGLGLRQATFEGKLMALPLIGGSADTAPMIWLRKDWLDELGLQPPKTMADIEAIAKAFTENDPDHNGKKDTFGLALEKNLFGGQYDLNGFFNGYHAFPMKTNGAMQWAEDSAGNIVPGPTAPEAKMALAQLAEMYKAGYIDPEFAVKDAGKVSESVVSEKIGMFFGMHWNAFSPLPDANAKNPQAEWRPYPIASVDGTITAETWVGTNSFFVVRKGIKHPEAAIKLLNFYIAKHEPVSPEHDPRYHMGPNQVGDVTLTPDQIANEYKYAPISTFNPLQNKLIYEGFQEYAKDRDPSKLSAWSGKDPYSLQENIEQLDGVGGEGLAGGVASKYWAGWIWVGAPFSAFGVISGYLDNNQMYDPVFYGAPTPTMTAKESALNKLVIEEYTKIIMGNAPVDDFDKFVQNWNSLGGAEMTQEVQAWAALQK